MSRQKHVTMFEQQITVVILAGGRGRRMDENDKGLVELQGKPLVQHVIEAISKQNSNILINANQNLARYREFSFPVISDEIDGFQGPLAGMATAMKAVNTPYIMTLPCDAPYVAAQYQAAMWSALASQQTELVVAHDGQRLQPVHALLPVSLQADLRRYLEGKNRRVDTWYSQYSLGLVDCTEMAEMFYNLNTPEQLAAYRPVAG